MVEDRSTGDSRGVLEDRGAIRADDRPPRCPEIDDRPRGGGKGAVDFAPVSRARGSPRVLEGVGLDVDRGSLELPRARVAPGSRIAGGVLNVDRPRVCRSRSRRIGRGFSPRCSISTGARRCPGARCRGSMSPRYLLRSQLFGGLWITCQVEAAFPQAVENLWITHFFACAVIVTLDFCYR